jgi:flagellar biosynthetic protein FlhB
VAEEHDPASKTEEATPRKLEDARRKGDVAKSHDVASWMSLAAACGVLAGLGPMLSKSMADALLVFIAAPHELARALEGGGGVEVARKAVLAGAPLLLAVMCAAALAGAGGNFLQQGFIWSPEKLKPDLSKVSPLKGFQRLFGVDGLVQFVKTLLKLVVTGWVAWLVLEPHKHELADLVRMDPRAVLALSIDLMAALVGSVLAFLGVTAAVDWIWQRQRFAQRMRMSREELKEDFKQSEGDPHVRARQKQIRAERSRKRMMANVPKATVVITNPTHYAVALRYVNGETAAPVCLAKGMDTIALKIRVLAGEHDIPIVEDPPLARALYAVTDIDEVIPREHYEAVAKVIGFIMGQKARRPQAAPPMR